MITTGTRVRFTDPDCSSRFPGHYPETGTTGTVLAVGFNELRANALTVVVKWDGMVGEHICIPAQIRRVDNA